MYKIVSILDGKRKNRHLHCNQNWTIWNLNSTVRIELLGKLFKFLCWITNPYEFKDSYTNPTKDSYMNPSKWFSAIWILGFEWYIRGGNMKWHVCFFFYSKCEMTCWRSIVSFLFHDFHFKLNCLAFYKHLILIGIDIEGFHYPISHTSFLQIEPLLSYWDH